MKRKYEKELASRSKENPKGIWNYIKSKSKLREGIGDLHINPNDHKSPKTEIDIEKANILGDYFSSVFTIEPEGDIPSLNIDQLAEAIPELTITEENVLKLLNTLKIDKSPGPDELHPRLLKELAASISKPIYLIFKQSLEKGTLPQEWENSSD